MRIAKEMFGSKKTVIMNFGLLLGAGVAITGTAALLFVAYWAFNVSAASLLGVTGAAAFLLGPIGLGVMLAVGLLALTGSAVYLYLHNQKSVFNNRIGGEFDTSYIYVGQQKKSDKPDVAVSVVSGFVSVTASVIVAAVAALGLLNPAGLILASVAAVAIFFIPFIKLAIDAVRARPAREVSRNLSIPPDVFPVRSVSGSQQEWFDYKPSSLAEEVEASVAADKERKGLDVHTRTVEPVDPLVRLGC